MQHSILLLLLINGACSFLFGDSSPQWNDLKVTWDYNVFSSWAFDSLPRDLSTSSKGFSLKDNQCVAGTGNFLGKRYRLKNDPAIITLYDVNGYIAGIQTAIPKASITPSGYLRNHPVVDDGDYWTLTAYFVDPKIICTTGRNAATFKTQGTGTGLWIQNGTNPLTDHIQIPLDESQIKSTKWTFGKCFYTMGNHYWHNVTADMSCANFVPFCLMYNKGILTAFCFAANADLSSKRYEHPTASISQRFINPVPDCFFKDPTFNKLSTIHVFLTGSPWFNYC